MTPHVLIAGAGIGGLALAQGLRRVGISFEIFERDPAFDSRAQGYRFRIDADGDSALRACLPPHLFELYQATSSIPSSPPAGAYNQDLEMFYRFDGADPKSPVAPKTPSQTHVTINRLTLRQVLLGELGDAIHFSKSAASAEQGDTQVRLHFADGSSAFGDALVAAEGINSPLRAQLLPHAEIIDLKMSCIYGRTPLTRETYSWLPELLLNGFTPILGPARRTFAVGPFRTREPFAEAAARIAPNVTVTPVDDYLMWLIVAPDGLSEVAPDDAFAPSANTPRELHAQAQSLIRDWHPSLQRIVHEADVAATFRIPIRSSRRIPAWPSSRITFLGDAIHAMTPAGGIGANTALRDARLLSQLLAETAHGNYSVLQAIEDFETEMRDYAFAAVERSLASAAYLYQFPTPARGAA